MPPTKRSEESTPEQSGGQQQQESTPIGDEAQAAGSEPLNPSGVPNQEFPDAKEDASVEAVSEAGGDEVQQRFDEANEKGYFGETPDQEDRERFTLKGQNQGQ